MKAPILTQALEVGLTVAEDTTRNNEVLHVTDLAVTIGEGCPRQLWLRLRGADKKSLTAGQMLMFWHGKRIHEDLTELLKAGLPREWEIIGVEVPMEFDGITGTADALIINRDTGEKLVIDYKTIRGRGFYFLPEDIAKPAHELQVQSYIYGLDKSTGFSADGGLVLYVDREGQNSFQQRYVPRNDEVVKEAITEAWLIRDAKEPPPILEPIVFEGKPTKTKGVPVTIKQPWMCDYCSYQDVTCHGALSYDHRVKNVIGHMVDGDFVPSNFIGEELQEKVSELIAVPF